MILHLIIGLIFLLNVSTRGANNFGFTKHSDDCSKYALMLQCGATSHFNKATGECDSIDKAGCIDVNKYNGCKRTVCFFGGFGNYKKFDFSQCTHIVLGPSILYDSTMHRRESEKFYNDIMGKKKSNPDLKVLLSVSEFNSTSNGFEEMVVSPKNRYNFIKQVILSFKIYKFDGLSVQWTMHEGTASVNKARLVTLVEELRTSFDKEGASSGKPTPILALTLYGTKYVRENLYDIPNLSKYVDFFMLDVMSLHNDPKRTGHHSPLLPINQWDQENVELVIRYFKLLGTPKDKMVVSVPLYGNMFTVAPGCDYFREVLGNATRVSYNKYCSILEESQALRFNLPNQKIPYLVKGNNTWLAYDDEDSVAQRVAFIASEGLGGVLIWQVKDDVTQPGICGADRDFPMTRAIVKACKTIPTFT